MTGIDLSENALALEAIQDVGPGQHFLGSEHTQENFKSAFYMSSSSDSNSFEQWSAEGGLDAAQRANAQWKLLVEEYEDPGLDPGNGRGFGPSLPNAKQKANLTGATTECRRSKTKKAAIAMR